MSALKKGRSEQKAGRGEIKIQRQRYKNKEMDCKRGINLKMRMRDSQLYNGDRKIWFKRYNGDLNRELVWYSNGPKQLAR